MVDRVIKLEGRGMRGDSYADVARRSGLFGILPTDDDETVIGKINADAAASADRAELAAEQATDLVLPENRFVAADLATARSDGEAGTVDGTYFIAVGRAEGEAEVRLRTAGGSDLIYTEITKTALASTDPGKGAGLVGFRQAGPAAVARTLGGKATERFHAMDLLGDGVDPQADHGALLTAAIAARFGTLAQSQSRTVVQIDFGDGRFVYNIETPIIVEQNHIRLVGDGAVLDCSGSQAIILDHAGTQNILFGNEVSGFTLKGTISEDAIEVRSASQVKVRDIRNQAVIAGAVVRFGSTLSSQTRSIKSDGEGGASCRTLIHEAPYEKYPGQFYGCIANSHTDMVAYSCTGDAVLLDESDHIYLQGDIETAEGCGVLLINSRFCTISTYMEKNGMGDPVPTDIRIMSDPAGKLKTRAINNRVYEATTGGELIGGVKPNAVHIIDADFTVIDGSVLSGDIQVDGSSERTEVREQLRFIGTLKNNTTNYLLDQTTFGATDFVVGGSSRLKIEAFGSGAAQIGSKDKLLDLYGVRTLGSGSTPRKNLTGYVDISGTEDTGSVTFPTPEPDSFYNPFLSLWDLSNSADCNAVKVIGRDSNGFQFRLDAPPGSGKTVRVHWFLLGA